MKRCLITLLLFVAVCTVKAEEPKAFSVNRYSLLWQSNAFRKAPPPKPPKPKRDIARQPDSNWQVAGIFVIQGKQGAVVMNSKTKAVEQISSDSESPSGLRLLRVHDTRVGQLPRIEVIENGRRIVLTGITPRPTTAPKAPKKAK